jgi:hypothetical protein
VWETKAENEGQAKRMRKGREGRKGKRQGREEAGSGMSHSAYRVSAKSFILCPRLTVSSFCLLGKYRNQLEEDLYFADSTSMLRVTERSSSSERNETDITRKTLNEQISWRIGEQNMCSERNRGICACLRLIQI